MVSHGDIIKLNFNPQKGHEQAGYRPAVVISNGFFNKKTNLAILCPITNGNVKICAVEKSPKSEIYAISNLFF